MTVNGGYGWNQDWFPDFWMRLGGCAAVTACDSCIYLKKYLGYDKAYPYNADNVTSWEYLSFADKMKPYLSPRKNGIDALDIYIDGLGRYLKDAGEYGVTLNGLEGGKPVQEAWGVLMQRIDLGFPVPFLMLKNKNPSLSDYVWHWFLVTGYKQIEKIRMVKVVTYGSWRWLAFDELWDTGFKRKGGIILFSPGKKI